MGRKRKVREPLPTIWHVPDELWVKVEPLIMELDPPKKTGRKRIEARAALDGILFRLRTGCQWNYLPAEYGDDSSIHRTFQRWVQVGLFEALWSELLLECEELGGVNWKWQAADGQLGRAHGARKKGPQTSALVPIPATEPVQEPRRASTLKRTGGHLES